MVKHSFTRALPSALFIVTLMNVQPARSATDGEALDLGRKVIAVQKAIRDPGAVGAMDSVTALGLDSRYYVMVRGWLTMQLAGDRSIAAASGDNVPDRVTERIEFLRKAIRFIDLE